MTYYQPNTGRVIGTAGAATAVYTGTVMTDTPSKSVSTDDYAKKDLSNVTTTALTSKGCLTSTVDKNLFFQPAVGETATPGIWFRGSDGVAKAGFGYTGGKVKLLTGTVASPVTALAVNTSDGVVSANSLMTNTLKSVNAIQTVTVTTFNTNFSDLRLKSEITPLAGTLDKVAALQGVSFKWKDAAAKSLPATTQLGLIAQDVEKVAPELVGDGPDGYKTLNYNGMSALFVEAIKQLKADNEALKARVKALEDKANK